MTCHDTSSLVPKGMIVAVRFVDGYSVLGNEANDLAPQESRMSIHDSIFVSII